MRRETRSVAESVASRHALRNCSFGLFDRRDRAIISHVGQLFLELSTKSLGLAVLPWALTVNCVMEHAMGSEVFGKLIAKLVLLAPLVTKKLTMMVSDDGVPCTSSTDCKSVLQQTMLHKYHATPRKRYSTVSTSTHWLNRNDIGCIAGVIANSLLLALQIGHRNFSRSHRTKCGLQPARAQIAQRPGWPEFRRHTKISRLSETWLAIKR